MEKKENEQQLVDQEDLEKAIDENNTEIIQILKEIKEIHEGQIPTEEELKELEQEQKVKDQELQEKEEKEEQFNDDLLESINLMKTDLVERNDKAIELLEISPDYSNVYEENQEMMMNQFDAINVLIGLILGIGVALGFIRGLSHD